MRLSKGSILFLAASLALSGAPQVAVAQLCKPVLSLRDVHISEMREMH
jgi:hypothetical protein